MAIEQTLAISRRYDVVSFGETMVRLSAPLGVRLQDADSLELTIGGAESNVAVALARLGRSVAWISALVDNPLGRRIEREVRSRGVDTSHVQWSPHGRVGVYFLDPGVNPRPTRVYYDRSDSAFANLKPDAIDPLVVSESRVLHLTGITPALSPNCAAICELLATSAHGAGVPLVFDVNYRARLWSPDAARAGISSLVRRAGILLCGAADAATIWGLSGNPAEVVKRLFELTRAQIVVVTLGERGAVAGTRSGALFDVPAIPVRAVDPVGAGDAFAAGFLHSWLADPTDVMRALRTATTLAALKMTVRGDHADVEEDELRDAVADVDGGGSNIIR